MAVFFIVTVLMGLIVPFLHFLTDLNVPPVFSFFMIYFSHKNVIVSVFKIRMDRLISIENRKSPFGGISVCDHVTHSVLFFHSWYAYEESARA